MPVVILNHTVADYDTWRTQYDADVERRKNIGLKEVICGQQVDDPNKIFMVFETENPQAIHKMLSDPNLAEVMKKAGVTSKPEVVIVQ